MNEATFEARVTAHFANLFPALAGVTVSVQEVLTLRFGHHLIVLDGKERSRVHGRYDVLFAVDGVPMVLMELKKPGNGITDQDVDQAVSYARLLDKMPPLVVASDGQETRCVGVFDKRPVDPGSVDRALLSAMITDGLKVAASALDSAVETLLGRDPAMWAALFRRLSERSLSALSGDPPALEQPLVRGFSLPRAATGEVERCVVMGSPLVALVGAPLSGKTNVLSQLVAWWQTGDFAPLYLDTTDVEVGLLQSVANLLSEEIFHARDVLAVRAWLSTGLPHSSIRPVFLVDGWTDRGQQQQLFELLNYAKAKAGAVVLAVDEATWNQLSRRDGRREPTRMGRDATVVPLLPLSADEFAEAQRVLLGHRVAYHKGAENQPEHRAARLVRLQYAIAQAQRSETAEPPPPPGAHAVVMIPPVTEPGLLLAAESFMPSDLQFRAAYDSLCRACMTQWEASLGPDLRLFVWGLGAVVYEAAREQLGEHLEILMRTGHVRLANAPGHKLVIIPILPELMAACFVRVLADRLKDVAATSGGQSVYKTFLHCASLPSGDLIAARVLRCLPQPLASAFIDLLIADEPRHETVTPGTHVLLQLEEGVQVPYVTTTDDVSPNALGSNMFPWLVLARIAGDLVMGGDYTVNLGIWWMIGRYPAPLLRQRPGLTPVDIHEVEGGGSYVCGDQGVVEPITWSMVVAFSLEHIDLMPLARRAVAENELFLVLRIHLAATTALEDVDPLVEARCAAVLSVLEPWLDKRLAKEPSLHVTRGRVRQRGHLDTSCTHRSSNPPDGE